MVPLDLANTNAIAQLAATIEGECRRAEPEHTGRECYTAYWARLLALATKLSANWHPIGCMHPLLK